MRPRSRAVLDSLARNAGKLALATTIGIVLAGITHIAAILMLPWLAGRDAYARLAPTVTAERAVLVAPPRAAGFGEIDGMDPMLAFVTGYRDALVAPENRGRPNHEVLDDHVASFVAEHAPEGADIDPAALLEQIAGDYSAALDRAVEGIVP